jgi:N-acetylneuraminic acid mutarotase
MKRQLKNQGILITALLFISFFSNAQWIAKAPLPGAGQRDGAVSWVIGNKCYIVGGNGHSDLQEYNPDSNLWTPKAPIPQGATAFGMGFVANGKGYLCGGNAPNFAYYSSLWEYNPDSNIWNLRAPFPGGKISGGFGFAIDNKGYVGCGDDSLFYRPEVYEYDPVFNSWAPKAQFVAGYRSTPYFFAVGSKGYVGGGWQGTEQNDLWEFDPVANSWNPKSALPGSVRQSAVSFESASHGYVGLGQTGFSTILSDVYEYDPANNFWQPLPSFAPGGRAWAAGFAFGNTIYIGTGWNFTTFYKDLYAYDLTTGIAENDNAQFSIFPNPASEFITVHTGDNKSIMLEIYSPLGEKILSTQIKNNEKIPIGNLSPGMYYLKIVSENNYVAAKKIQIIK